MLERNGFSRRALLERALVLAGATVALSACDAIGLAGADSPFRFDASQMALLTALSDVIVPKGDSAGAVEVGVPATFEGLMANWASPETREMIVAALAKVDALSGDGRAFASLDAGEQFKLLKAHDTAALQQTGEREGGVVLATIPTADPGYTLLKELVITLFYYSEVGQTKELGYVHAPGRWDPSVPVTPETRPLGGTSGF